VLFTLLASAGVGSYLSERLSRSWGRRTILIIPAFGLIAVLLIVVFPSLRDLTLGMDRPSRILLVMASIIPIGIPLGMPFPLGIQALHSRAPNLIPWAWGVNGFMTIVGSLLAVILSMKIGFDATLLVAVGIYVVALLSFLMLSRGRRSSEPGSGP
jgi:MFS family permease